MTGIQQFSEITTLTYLSADRKESTIMKFRVFNAHTDETIEIFEAEDIFEASLTCGKVYGVDNEDVDLEYYEA